MPLPCTPPAKPLPKSSGLSGVARLVLLLRIPGWAALSHLLQTYCCVPALTPQYANPAFKSTMGYQSGDLLGKEVPAQEEGTLLGKVRL